MRQTGYADEPKQRTTAAAAAAAYTVTQTNRCSCAAHRKRRTVEARRLNISKLSKQRLFKRASDCKESHTTNFRLHLLQYAQQSSGTHQVSQRYTKDFLYILLSRIPQAGTDVTQIALYLRQKDIIMQS